jgi:hypothetical protein
VFKALPFNTQYYFHRALFYLTTPLFVVLLYLFGDNPEHFDLIYIGALGLSCVFCWSDKDTLGTLVILLGLWCLSRLLYTFVGLEYILEITYVTSLLISVFYLKRVISVITVAITLLCIATELYWSITVYVNRPTIYYYVGLLVLSALSRELLLQRVFLLNKYFGYCSGKIALDWQIRGVLLTGYVLLAMMLTEYFFRHVIGFTQITFVYYNYTLVANFLSGITLALVYMHYFYNESQKHMPA